MWLIDAVVNGFATATPVWHIEAVRALVGIALLAKALLGITRGGWSRFERGSFERFRVDRSGGRPAAFVARAHRPIIVVRVVSAVAVAIGWAPHTSLAVSIGGLLTEQAVERRRNTAFLVMTCAALLAGGRLAEPLPWTFSSARTSENTWSQVLLVLLLTQTYWNGAWLKARSRQVRSGAMLAQYVWHRSQIQHRTEHREFWFPAWATRLFGQLSEDCRRRWRVLGWTAIASEAVLPVALLVPRAWPWAALAGLAMHAAFLVLMPRRLFHFSLATVSTYLAFLDS